MCLQKLFLPLADFNFSSSPSPLSPSQERTQRKKVLFFLPILPHSPSENQSHFICPLLSPHLLTIFPVPQKNPFSLFSIPREKGEEEAETHCFQGFERVWRGRRGLLEIGDKGGEGKRRRGLGFL